MSEEPLHRAEEAIADARQAAEKAELLPFDNAKPDADAPEEMSRRGGGEGGDEQEREEPAGSAGGGTGDRSETAGED